MCARSSVDRAADFGSAGRGFESLRARQPPSHSTRCCGVGTGRSRILCSAGLRRPQHKEAISCHEHLTHRATEHLIIRVRRRGHLILKGPMHGHLILTGGSPSAHQAPPRQQLIRSTTQPLIRRRSGMAERGERLIQSDRSPAPSAWPRRSRPSAPAMSRVSKRGGGAQQEPSADPSWQSGHCASTGGVLSMPTFPQQAREDRTATSSSTNHPTPHRTDQPDFAAVGSYSGSAKGRGSPPALLPLPDATNASAGSGASSRARAR